MKVMKANNDKKDYDIKKRKGKIKKREERKVYRK